MNNLIFNNLGGELVGGVSIKNLVEMDREKYMGGSTNNIGNNGIGLSRFNNYVVPAGLYLSTQTGGKTDRIGKRDKIEDSECISSELYEKLFGIVRYDIPVVEKNRKTKKTSIKEGKNKTKKH